VRKVWVVSQSGLDFFLVLSIERSQLIVVLDDATQTEGWDLVADFLDAYHPETADEFPHMTTLL